MPIELRNSGISVVGDAPWGTHFCHFYETKQDLLDTLVPYFKAGLESKEFCLWVVSDTELITVEEAKGALSQAVPDLERHIADESIEILDGHDWYFEQHALNLERAKQGWDVKLKRALARGYEGMRASADTFWLAEKDWKDFFDYEKQVNDWITNQSMSVMCTYPLAKSGATEVLDVVQAHQFAMARRQGEWEVIESPQLVQAKAEIKKLNEELERRVIERTNELSVANEELRKEITERNQAEDETRRQKETLQKIVDHIPVMINFVGADGRIKLVNPEWERTLGWSLEEIRQQNVDVFAECYPDPQYRQQVLKFVAEAEGEWADFKTRVRDGRVIDTSFVRVHLSDGTSIGIGKDITEQKQAEEALDERLRFETLVTELSAAFANLSPNEVDREIDRSLQSLAEFLGVDRASFFQFGEDWTTLYRSHSYTAPGIEPLPPPPIGMKDQFPWITDQLRRGITVKWPRIPDDMPVEAIKEKEYAAKLGVKSGLNIPVRMGGSVICAITFTSIATYRDWPDAMVARLRLVGEIFAAAVERKRAEAALRKSEEQFRQMAENIREVFWLATADMSKILYISPAYETVWGQSRESSYQEPRSFFTAIHDEDRSRVVAIIERDREKGFEVEYRVVRPDGSIRCIRDRGFPIGDESGRFYRVAGIAEDITERKDAEEKLKRSENQLAEAQRLAHIGSWDWDLRTNAVTWSDELYHIFGLQPGTIGIAGEVDRFIHPDDLDLGWDTVKRAVASKEPYDYYHRILRPDGTERIARSRGSIISDDRGEPIKVFGATQDVTELKRAEEDLKATSDQLRALSTRLQSVREEEATRIAREIHDELGSALTRLKWDLELLGKERLKTQERVDRESSGQRIDEMIQLVDATVDTIRRISSELRPSILDDLGLAAALRWHTEQFQHRTGIVTDCDCFVENLGLNQAQSTAVFRIFEEALTNVMRHADATKVDVRLEKDKGDLVVTIRDNGRGITEAQQLDPLSLGLLGMRERANLIGGEISIAGMSGEGTLVTVRLPISEKH